MDDWFAIAIDKGTGYYHTCSIGNEEFAKRTAKYYRSIGYNARCLPGEEAEAFIDELYDRQRKNEMMWRDYEAAHSRFITK